MFFTCAMIRCGSSISHMLVVLGNSPAKLLRKTDAVKMSTPGAVYKSTAPPSAASMLSKTQLLKHGLFAIHSKSVYGTA